jgi:hypothetical protein
MTYLLALTGGLQILDGILTQRLVGSGLVTEANSLMKPLISEGSFILFKIAGFLACAVLLYLLHKRFARLAVATASGVSVFYALVLIWNLGILFGVRFVTG